MLSRVTLDDHNGSAVTLHDPSGMAKRVATAASGLSGGVVPDLRSDIANAVQRHGGVNLTRYTEGAQPTFTFEVRGDPAADDPVADCLAEFRAMSAAMLQTLDYGPALLKWTEGSTGLDLQRLVKLNSAIDPPEEGNVPLIDFPVTFYAEDPRAYSQALRTFTANGANLLSNGTFEADAIGGAANGWGIAYGGISASVSSAWAHSGSKSLLVNAPAGVGGILQSSSVTVQGGAFYSVAAAFSVTAFGTGTATITLNFRDAGANILLASTKNITATGGVIAWNVQAPAGAVSAEIQVAPSASAGGPVTFYMDDVTVCPIQQTVVVVNGGTRDTPLVVDVSGPTWAGPMVGGLFLTGNGGLPPMLATDTLTIDLGARTVKLNGANAAQYVDPASSTWDLFKPDQTGVSFRGLMVGASVSVSLRDAY